MCGAVVIVLEQNWLLERNDEINYLVKNSSVIIDIVLCSWEYYFISVIIFNVWTDCTHYKVRYNL